MQVGLKFYARTAKKDIRKWVSIRNFKSAVYKKRLKTIQKETLQICCLIPFILSGPDLLSDDDLMGVIDLLDPAQLQKLYVRMGLEKTDTDKAKYHESRMHPDLGILRQWRKTRGPEATKDALLQALEKCGNMEARDNLSWRWKGL